MKRIHFLTAALTLFAVPLLAQDDITISYFQGGSYKAKLAFDSAIFSGVGLRSAGLAGIVSGLGADPAMIVRHPAALATVRRPMAVLDLTPPISINPASFVDLDKSIESAVDESLDSYDVPKSEIAYPNLDLRFGQSGVLGSGGVIYPTDRGNFGFALYHPLRLSLDMLGSGFSTMIETSKAIGDRVTVVQFATQMSPTIKLNLNTTAASLSYGYAMSRNFAFGATVDWLSTRLDLNAFFKLDGIMLLRQQGASEGQEYAFNDPFDTSIRTEDGEQNALDQWAVGSYRGSGWGGKFSTLYLLRRGWSLDAAFSLPVHVALQGNLEFVQNLVPALTAENLLSDDENVSLFDVTELNLAKPTLTKRLNNPTATNMQLNFPASLTLGTTRAFGPRGMISLNYVQYFGKFSYSYLQYEQGLALKQSFRFGTTFPFAWFLSPETALLKLFGVDPRPSMRLGLGVTFADEIKEGFSYQTSDKNYTQTGIILPSVALGKSFRLMDGVETDLLLVALPSSICKFSFMYRF